MNIANSSQTVLVTGGTGYVAGWVIVALLRKGYQVRTTVRDLQQETDVHAAVSSEIAPEGRLTVYAADLTQDIGWKEAITGCDFVIHVASPMGQGEPKNTDLLTPARGGTIRVLRMAAEAGVKRVVMTSSTAAADPIAVEKTPHGATNETAWTDPDRSGIHPYPRSKTLAERAAWSFIDTATGKMTLATILPSMILGPVLSDHVSGSVEVVYRMLAGTMPGIPRIGFSIVDVRDLADLHLRAMVSPVASNQRFIASSDFLWLSDVAAALRTHLGSQAAKLPTRRLPDFVLRIAALFNAEARFMAPMLGKKSKFDTTKAAHLLGWHPRSAVQTVRDCADSLIRRKGI